MQQITIHSPHAPTAIGPYSQAIKVGNTVYLSGQIPLLPTTMQLISEGIEGQIKQVFANLAAVANAAGGNLTNLVKLTIFLTDLSHFSLVNEIMAHYCSDPYPARTVIGVTALPKDAMVAIDAILVL